MINDFTGILSRTVQRIWFIMFKDVFFVAVGIWICSATANSHGGETKWEFHILVCSSILLLLLVLGAVQWRVKHMHVWIITKGASEATNPCLLLAAAYHLLLPPQTCPPFLLMLLRSRFGLAGACWAVGLGGFPLQTLLCPHQSRFPAVLAPVQRFVVTWEGVRGSDNQLWPLLLKARLVQPCLSYSWVLFYPSFTGSGEGWVTRGFSGQFKFSIWSIRWAQSVSTKTWGFSGNSVSCRNFCDVSLLLLILHIV